MQSSNPRKAAYLGLMITFLEFVLIGASLRDSQDRIEIPTHVQLQLLFSSQWALTISQCVNMSRSINLLQCVNTRIYRARIQKPKIRIEMCRLYLFLSDIDFVSLSNPYVPPYMFITVCCSSVGIDCQPCPFLYFEGSIEEKGGSRKSCR